MNEEDYAYDKFVGQRSGRDIPKRLHETKKTAANKNENTREESIALVDTKMLTATTNQTDVLANIEHKQQQNEEKLQSKVISIAPETQSTANRLSEQSNSAKQECTVSDAKLDDNTLATDTNIDNQVTMDDNLFMTSSSDVIMKYDDKKTEQSNNEGDSCGTHERRNEDNVAESCQTLPNSNSGNIQDANASSSSNIEVARNTALFPPSVDKLDVSHIEELPDRSLLEVPEDEVINKGATALSPSLVKDNKVESEWSHIEELPGETGPKEHTTANQIDNTTLSLQDDTTNIMPSLNTEQPDQLNVEGGHKEVICDDDGQLEVELPQTDSDVTFCLTANDPALPTLAAANNPALLMVIDNQGSNIPIPPPPPSIRAPPLDNEPSAGLPSPDDNHPVVTLPSPQVSSPIVMGGISIIQ